MSARTATIIIAAFSLAAIVFSGWLMGGGAVIFSIVCVIIAVFCAAIGIVYPAVKKKAGGVTPGEGGPASGDSAGPRGADRG